MDSNKLLQLSSRFLKCAEYIENDPFSNIIGKADQIIQKVLTDNNDYYSKEYFGGKPFSVKIVDANKQNSIIYISANPKIQNSPGIIQGTNIQYFENELSDKISIFGVKIKIK